jgi:hypothetical protein
MRSIYTLPRRVAHVFRNGARLDKGAIAPSYLHIHLNPLAKRI